MHRNPIPTTLYIRFLDPLAKILSSYTCLPLRLIRNHLVFYFSNLNRPPGKMGHIPQLWIRTYYALRMAFEKGYLLQYPKGDLLQHPKADTWLYLPGTDDSVLEERFKQNSSTYDSWLKESKPIGYHAQSVVRSLLDFKSFRQTKNPPTFYLASGQEVVPDAYTLTPIHAAFEVKNGLSDVWSDPRPIRNPSQDYQQILNHFQMCKQNRLIPGLIAPKLDPTFYDFAKDNNGLCFEFGFQIFHPDLVPLRDEICSNLGFCNIVVASEEPPYPSEFAPFLKWLDTIK